MDLIKIALGDYPRYEELLLRKDKFEKEALQWYENYIRESVLILLLCLK